ncbi:hypothetical protein BJ508DRAFT_336750 [Ascobolus immersus RN42]|uniref:Uncharacterized protein n=1 Tax=Ascobolus immersus RN42 TaxID=1160509 RepID=A0A3N4H7I9_ASCIM|nr:hypothetical protein BJ508DRAFT_336750 [Ascobolus immersus RN42]
MLIDNYYAPFNPPTDPYEFKGINDRDSVRMKVLKSGYNSFIFSLKAGVNNVYVSGVAEARVSFILLTNINTGVRPAGAPWNYVMVIEYTLQQWYELGEGIKLFSHWRILGSTLGFCRSQWIDFHRIPRILTIAERNDPTTPPPGGWP